MNEPSNKKLYQKVKKKITASNPKHSAYRSASIVKQYKSELKKISPNKKPYTGKKPKEGLSRWFDEKWTNQRGGVGYKSDSDVYRPNVRVSKKTPTTFSELSKSRINKAQLEKKRRGRVSKF